MYEEPYYLHERTRVARENLASLIWIVLILGLAIGTTTEILSRYVIKERYLLWWLIGALSLAATVTALVIWFLYSRGYDTELKLDLLLPFRITRQQVEVVEAPAYPVTVAAHRAVAKGLKGEEGREFLEKWHQSPSEPFKGFVQNCLMDLVAYLILFIYRKYAEASLTPSAQYFHHRWIYRHMKADSIPQNKWPEQLRENIFVQKLGRDCFQAIDVPKKVKLKFREYRKGDVLQAQEIIFKSRYGKIFFSISPYPAKVDDRSRWAHVMRKYCGVSERAKLFIVQIPLRVVVDIGGLRIFSRKFHRTFLPWSTGLLESLRTSLDWNECIKEDLERMVVELRRRVEEISETKQNGKEEESL